MEEDKKGIGDWEEEDLSGKVIGNFSWDWDSLWPLKSWAILESFQPLKLGCFGFSHLCAGETCYSCIASIILYFCHLVYFGWEYEPCWVPNKHILLKNFGRLFKWSTIIFNCIPLRLHQTQPSSFLCQRSTFLHWFAGPKAIIHNALN